MKVGAYTTGVVGIVVAIVIVVSVALPIISANLLPDESPIANAETINTLLGIIPVLLIIGIVVGVVSIFIAKKQ